MSSDIPNYWKVKKQWPPNLIDITETKFKEGDRVYCKVFPNVKATVKYVVTKPKGEVTLLIIFDRKFSLGHDGDGGCHTYNLPYLPEYNGRCFWVSEDYCQLIEEGL